jgi:uncharacterized membrane protein
MRYAVAYLSTAVVFLGLDFVWLGFMGDRFYRRILHDVLRPGFELAPAVLFYLLIIAGILFFAVSPALESDQAAVAAVRGALFGFFTYATYDLTSQATVRNWTWILSLTDIAWGTFLTATAATLGFLVTRKLSSS